MSAQNSLVLVVAVAISFVILELALVLTARSGLGIQALALLVVRVCGNVISAFWLIVAAVMSMARRAVVKRTSMPRSLCHLWQFWHNTHHHRTGSRSYWEKTHVKWSGVHRIVRTSQAELFHMSRNTIWATYRSQPTTQKELISQNRSKSGSGIQYKMNSNAKADALEFNFVHGIRHLRSPRTYSLILPTRQTKQDLQSHKHVICAPPSLWISRPSLL